MESNIERDCSNLGGLFQTIINDMKTSTPVWEDFMSKAAKLNQTLRATILAASAFLDAFQKVADMATNTRGATRDIGSALTRMCMRHRSIEHKLKNFTSSIMDCLVVPLQDRVEEWKKIVNQLDKDHAKEYKKVRQEIKKKSSDTIRLQKKARKGKSDVQNRLDSAMQDVTDKYVLLEETEKNAVRSALIEERSRFCMFVNFLKPVVEGEIAMLTEITHLQSLMDDITNQVSDPLTLPDSSEQVVLDCKGKEPKFSFQTPPSSPGGSVGSRKSSMCSLNSLNSCSSDSRSSGSMNSHSPSNHYRYRTMSQPPPPPMRLSSVSSQDSGFTSQDTLFLRPTTPTAQETGFTKGGSQDSSLSDDPAGKPPESPSLFPAPPPTWINWGSTNHETEKPQSAPPPLAPLNRPPLPEKPLVTIKPKVQEAQHGSPYVPDFNQPHPDQIVPQPIYMNPHELRERISRREEAREPGSVRHRSLSVPARRFHQQLQMQEGADDVTADLTLALARGLGTSDMEGQGSQSSRNSLQTCSSGYATQSTTPSCSEDTIASQDYDYYSMDGDGDPNYERFSTIPRSGDFSNSYQPTVTPKRPASTTGIPNNINSRPGTPGGTLRRNSSQKNKPPPPVRRSTSNPIPQDDFNDYDAQSLNAGQPIYEQPNKVYMPRPASSGSLIQSNYQRLGLYQQSHMISQQQSNVHQPQQQSSSIHPLQQQQSGVHPLQQQQSRQQRLQMLLQQQQQKQQPMPHYLTHRRSCSDMAHTKPSALSGSATLSRKDLITSLEAKFSRQFQEQPPSPEQSNGTPTNSPTDDSTEDGSRSPSPTGNSLMSQIRRGVKLRPTSSNDRSAPRIA
ncbi:protein MTSS 1-like isoform X2 [Ptychodera flava]|uniref:protein MTSS 1-like isoform X2 n=1 Tax=Ptychodera flava TaxID=63121 RepID=UPI00396A1D3A